MAFERIAKSKLSKISVKKGNPILAHLTPTDLDEPLCTAVLAQGARWLREDDENYGAVRDCKNCVDLVERFYGD